MSAPKIFISYSHRDAEWVGQFAQRLSELYVDVWLDDWALVPGDNIPHALEEGLRQSDAIVAILSKGDEVRPNVLFELGVALGMGKRLIPVVARDVDTTRIPFDVRARKYLLRDSPDDTARQVAAALQTEGASTDQQALTGLAKAHNIYDDQGRQEAVKMLDEVISRNPKSAKAFYNRACVKALNRSRYSIEEILADLRQAIAIEATYKATAASDRDFDAIKDSKEFGALIS